MSTSPEFLVLSVLGVAVTGGALVVLEDRRVLLGTLALQYVAATAIASGSTLLQVPFAKLVAGLLACVILWVTLSVLGWPKASAVPATIPASRPFRLIAALLLAMSAVGVVTGRLLSLPGVNPWVEIGAWLLVALGLLNLGLQQDPLRVGLGLMTVLSGFECLYGYLEPSLLVNALLATAHLGLALSASYLIQSHHSAESGGEWG